MSRQSFRVSPTGKQKILEARNKKGWKISQDDLRPLQAASLFVIEEYVKVKQIKSGDRADWSRNLERIFQLKRHTDRERMARIKVKLIKSTAPCIEIVKKLIYDEEIYPAGISYGTWTRFCSRNKQESIRESAFKAYCHILGLNWQEIGEPVTRKATKSSEEVELNSPFQSVVYQNIVAPNCIGFVERKKQLKRMLQYLADDRIDRFNIEGIGGVAKTFLVLEAVYLFFWNAQKYQRSISKFDVSARTSHHTSSRFKAIIYLSAQQQHLKVRQILPCLQQAKTLEDILTAIAITLKSPQILQGDLLTQVKKVTNRLRQLPTILILDRLEFYEEIEQILGFIYELPPTVKVITTTSKRLLLKDFQTISVKPLPESRAIQLIEHQLQSKQLHLKTLQY